MGFLMGLCAFGLFFLSDYNDWRLGNRRLKVCFPAAALLLVFGTVLETRRGIAPTTGVIRGLFCVFSLFFLVLLIYTLFFALPVEASYAKPGEDRQACTAGVYALCRHPGVLWFAGLYLCLWAAFGLPLWQAVILSGLNVLLVVFEDRCVFPAKLTGYAAYQRTTPFLIPNGKSIRAFCHNH